MSKYLGNLRYPSFGVFYSKYLRYLFDKFRYHFLQISMNVMNRYLTVLKCVPTTSEVLNVPVTVVIPMTVVQKRVI